MQNRPRPVLNLTADCACGAVHLSVNGPVHSMLLCACRDCQKATGTGHSTVAMVDATSLSLSGTTKSFVRTADSGAIFTQYFCPICATPLFANSSRAPTHALLPVGLFGVDNDWFAPSQLIFARSHHDWDLVPPDLPQHQKYREAPAKP